MSVPVGARVHALVRALVNPWTGYLTRIEPGNAFDTGNICRVDADPTRSRLAVSGTSTFWSGLAGFWDAQHRPGWCSRPGARLVCSGFQRKAAYRCFVSRKESPAML